MTIYDNYTFEQFINEAIALADLGSKPEGPKGQLEAIGLAQACALIAIAKSLDTIAAELVTERERKEAEAERAEILAHKSR